MSKKKSPKNSLSRSWREISQSANRKVVTAHARRRILRGVFRGTLAAATTVAFAAGVYFGFGYWREGVQKMNTVLPPQPLKEIVITTDGVLTKSWVESVLALPHEADIMTIDIHRKKQLLEGHGQIKSAVIRRFHETLTIDIEERMPVARLVTRDEVGRIVELLVDRDGYVYRGTGYDRYEISTIPFLDGVRLQRSGDGFHRLAGLGMVDDLLRIARNNFPNLYHTWKVVDLDELPLIKVRSDDFKEIVFGPGRETEQLQWLDIIAANNRRQMVGMQERVDLSLGNQVVVR